MSQKLTIILSCLLFSTPICTTAQYNNPANSVWAMSNYCGLDFNNGTVVPITTSAHPLTGNPGEGCASIADEEGDLMFYTDGMTLWDDIGNIMPNGNNVDGAGSAQSMTQNSVFVPFPNNPQLYYLFVLAQRPQTGNSVVCRIINRSLNNGHGDIDTANSLDERWIDSLLLEKIISISGCNNDIWLLVRDGSNSVHRYHSFHITASGLNTTPVNSIVNYIIGGAGTIGAIKVNEQRTKIVECNAKLILRDFNPNTGVVSGGQFIDSMINGYYGAAFSADGTKVYTNSGGTFQFDLNAANITASKTLVGAGNVGTHLNLGPDGKIYLLAHTPTNPGRYMARVNSPNNAGTACGFQDSVLSLHFQGSSVLRTALPNEVWMPFTGGTTTGHLVKDTQICNYSPAVVLQAAPGQSAYQWDNGSTGPSRSITQPGTYWVNYTDVFCNHQVDTYKISSALTPALSVTQTGYVLSTTATYASYQWYKGSTMLGSATNQTLNITANGIYSVKVSNTAGCSDSVSINVSNYTALEDVNAIANNIHVYPNPSSNSIHISSPVKVQAALYSIEGKCLKAPVSNTYMDISDLSKGVYLLKVMDMDGRLLMMEKVVKE